MPDTYRLIAPESIRGKDLCQWHVVEVSCWSCHHIRVVPHAPLKAGKRGDLTLAAMHFRCEWCGEAGPHKVTVYALPRNW